MRSSEIPSDGTDAAFNETVSQKEANKRNVGFFSDDLYR